MLRKYMSKTLTITFIMLSQSELTYIVFFLFHNKFSINIICFKNLSFEIQDIENKFVIRV